MPANFPKCFVFKSPLLTDEDLEQIKTAIPLAIECLQCQRRKDKKLEKMCWKSL